MTAPLYKMPRCGIDQLIHQLTRISISIGAQYASVPDIPSPLYPDRPIRPLPKHRIRSRLSPGVAESILYPSQPAETTSLNATYKSSQPERVNGFKDSSAASRRGESQHNTVHQGRFVAEGEPDSDEEEVGQLSRALYHAQRDYPDFNGLHSSHGQFFQQTQKTERSDIPPRPSNSNSSSVDGYESFENTKNKKKRKIPTPGNASGHHTHLSADLANLGISSTSGADRSSPDELAGGTGQYYGAGYALPTAGGAASAPSGTVKARLSRSQLRTANPRSPLGASSDGSNAWVNCRSGKARPRDWNAGATTKTGDPYCEQFFKSVEEAAFSGLDQSKEQTTRTVAGKFVIKDQMNANFRQQDAARTSAPAKTQFTFTASSDVIWPGGSSIGPGGHFLGTPPPPTGLATRGTPFQSNPIRDMATHGTQTSPHFTNNRRSAQTPAPPQFGSGMNRQPLLQQQPGPSDPQTPQQTKKTRPRPHGKEYSIAARQRRLHQQYNNYHHPPSNDELWICEFCEYESIFGAPPEALVRQYEIKDRKERRRLAEKRRLLEKAKMKGRKGKKNGKSATKGSAASTPKLHQHQQQPHHHHHHQMADPTQMQNQSTQSKEYLPDEFFDDEEISVTVPNVPAASAHLPIAPNGIPRTQGVPGQNGSKLGATADGIKTK